MFKVASGSWSDPEVRRHLLHPLLLGPQAVGATPSISSYTSCKGEQYACKARWTDRHLSLILFYVITYVLVLVGFPPLARRNNKSFYSPRPSLRPPRSFPASGTSPPSALGASTVIRTALGRRSKTSTALHSGAKSSNECKKGWHACREGSFPTMGATAPFSSFVSPPHEIITLPIGVLPRPCLSPPLSPLSAPFTLV